MKQYKLIMTPEQELLLAKHLGEMRHVYSVMYESYKKDNNEEMMTFYKTYLDEVETLVDLLFTVFKKEKGGKQKNEQ